MPTARTFLTVPEAAELLRIDTSTLYRAIRGGEFPAVRIRARYLVPGKVIEELIANAIADTKATDPAAVLRRAV
ncbi:helix-turn-helix domain-containing protein [Pseudonocardia oroxyli]|uniref:Transcriptional regulator, AlpA family n=1 Tax=Pseudonocardia oroxyli TaxID=366584 RepID=A0A1G7IS35_PSEOR|nr:helix-turn-helix domain-containing protein [Pseudonocardia oroxyli]SDF15487.1 transcriptional regulator, AlpA family [Pseudonocardia oroxyli]